MSTTDIPVASLYYSVDSPWSLAAVLTLEEKGYGIDEVILKPVDTTKANNFSPEFLRINITGTLPTLVIPLDKTLSPEIESRYKPVTDPKKILDLLDKSRSARSQTSTTSKAPAPILSPATISHLATFNNLIDLVHSEPADPEVLLFSNPRFLVDSPEVLISTLTERVAALSAYLADAEQEKIKVSDKVKGLWRINLATSEQLLQVLKAPSEELKQQYLANAKQKWNVDLKRVLEEVNKTLVGPFALGDQLSLADIHIGAWLARIAHLSGAVASDDGNTVVAKIEAQVGCTFPPEIPSSEVRRRAGLDAEAQAAVEGQKESKLAALWDILRQRPSWVKVYGQGLH